MNIGILVLAVFVGIAIAKPDNSKKVGLPLIFPTLIYSDEETNSSRSLRNEDKIKEISSRNFVLTARPYYRSPFEEDSTYSRRYRDAQEKPPSHANNNMKIGGADINMWPFEKAIETVNNNWAKSYPNEPDRMLGDISGSSWNYRPSYNHRDTTKKPKTNRIMYRGSYYGRNGRNHMGDISGNQYKTHGGMVNPYEQNIDVYNNYGDRLAERMVREFPSEIDGGGARIVGDISGFSSWRPYRPPNGNGQNVHNQNPNAKQAWLRQERDEEDEQFPHFPNHAEYF